MKKSELRKMIREEITNIKEAKNKFKIGDQVKYVGSISKFKNHIGKVNEIYPWDESKEIVPSHMNPKKETMYAVDFGMAKHVPFHLTGKGTPHFCSPESDLLKHGGKGFGSLKKYK